MQSIFHKLVWPTPSGHLLNGSGFLPIITIQQNEEKYRDMGTTLTCACLYDNKLYFSWVGDSRLYLMKSSESSIEMLTRDHTLDRKKIDANALQIS